MHQRFDFTQVAMAGYTAMLGVHSYVQNSGLDLGLLELVKIRASQINGCAFCLAMHIPLARKHGVTDHQLNLLVAWREAPVYSPRERAASSEQMAATPSPGSSRRDCAAPAVSNRDRIVRRRAARSASGSPPPSKACCLRDWRSRLSLSPSAQPGPPPPRAPPPFPPPTGLAGFCPPRSARR